MSSTSQFMHQNKQNTDQLRTKEKQDKLLKQQLEKEREEAIITEIQKTEQERIKKKGLKTLK